MPTLIQAPHLTGFVPPDSSLATPGATNPSIPAFGCHRVGPFHRSDTRSTAPVAETTATPCRPAAVPDPHGVETDAPCRSRQGVTRRAARILDWLRAGAAMARYSTRFLPAVLRCHSFAAPSALPVLRMTTSLPGSRIDEWKKFFQSPEGTTPLFTYFTPENSRLLFGMLNKFGINFRHLLLVQHDLVANPGTRCLIPDAAYELEAHVAELRVRPRQNVALAFRCVVRRAGHPAPVFETSDRFLVKEVPLPDCEALRCRGDLPRGADKEALAPRLDPESPSVRRHSLRVPMGAGLGFGLLSGDLNLAHAHHRLARWFGHPRPFAQGLYTSNQVVATLARRAGQLPTRLSVRFCRPLVLGQDALLLHSDRAFEVLDASGKLVAAGTFGA